jgi:hypothetical protein
MNDIPVSKVLVLDESPEHLRSIKKFCDENELVALKVRSGAVMNVLRTNIDLGAILLSESYGGSPEEAARIAAEIHAARPELPVIMRREGSANLEGLAEPVRRAVCAAYIANDMAALRKVIDERIFCLMYPNALLRGIAEITQSVLANQFAGARISVDTPYIVHDRIIFGELFSLMQLESAWCRGYMMLQTEEGPLLALAGHPEEVAATSFRTVNDLLAEITNLVWGAFKNRYLGDTTASSGAQVPLIVNHKHKYISFGTSNPQLCFRFTLADAAGTRSTTLYARFVFNLSWSPEDFKEIPQEFAGLVESGELQLF